MGKTDEIYSVLKRSINKSLYLQLNNIHEQTKKDTDNNTNEKNPSSNMMTVFHEYSQVDMKGLLTIGGNSPTKKRSNSVYTNDMMDGYIHVDPILIYNNSNDHIDNSMHVDGGGDDAKSRTNGKEEKSAREEKGSGKKMKRTISDPNIHMDSSDGVSHGDFHRISSDKKHHSSKHVDEGTV